MKKLLSYFSKFELFLWFISLFMIILSFCIFGGDGYLTLIASLIGATSLIFGSKGNPISQILMIAFSVLYGVISYSFKYYGEMITYLGMTLPMAVISLISWLKNPHGEGHAEVEVNTISKRETAFALALTTVTTVVFCFILKSLNTVNLLISTLSVFTSFLAAYLTFRRSPYFPFAYALNDCVLIVLWIMATIENLAYMSVIVCFLVFLVNDSYCFINWKRLQKRQQIENGLR